MSVSRLARSVSVTLLLAFALLGFHAAPAGAQPAAPLPDPGADPNVFYGQTAAGAEDAPVLVFIHGLRGHAADWWVRNNMYQLAYNAGYRTAFININANLTRNDGGVTENAAVLKRLLPKIARRFRVPQFYVVAHSKGGVDTQAALMDPAVAVLAKAVFQISPPNHGSELADWAFGPGRAVAQTLGLLTPGVFAMKTANMAQFRAQADPIAIVAGTPYFTMAGTTFLGNPLTAVTGAILRDLTGGKVNDGLVTIDSTRLPVAYATDLGGVPTHHFNTNEGDLTFSRIQAEIERIEGFASFEKIATGGFGDRQNSFAWSMGWFNGQLYVGTGRSFLCVTFATADRQTGTHMFRPFGPDYQCAPTIEDLPLAAEIWRYTPATRAWQRVFKSPEDIPIVWNASGAPVKFTARDMAFRGMTVFREPDGTEALYVAGVSPSVLFDRNGLWAADPGSFPPPRLLRSTDGVTFTPVPQTPGTFLGDIGTRRDGAVQVRGFRSLHVHAGRLFVSASDFRGVGFVIASANPAAGDNSFFQASPSADALPIWTLETFNGWLYATTGDRTNPVGYGVWKTRGIGPGPYVWQPVVTQGAFQIPQYRSPDALSIAAFNGKLYVGSDRPTELIRINPDDTWELVVGGPRMTPTGLKRPISGMLTGFGNLFNGHFWRMVTHGDTLYLGTWDWSVGTRVIPTLEPVLQHEFGADFFKTKDGRFWQPVTKTGFGDPFNYGVRTLQSTPAGLFVGTANPFYGLQVFKATEPSAAALTAAAAQSQGASSAELGAPDYLEAASSELSGDRVMLTWQAPAIDRHRCGDDDHDGDDDREHGKRGKSGRHDEDDDHDRRERRSAGRAAREAIQYQIFRSSPVRFLDTVPPDFTITIPGTNVSFTIDQIRAGALDQLCRAAETVLDCEMVRAIKENALVPGPYTLIFSTGETYFIDDSAPAGVQSMYYVKAMDAEGHVSEASNAVGGPSAAAPIVFSTLEDEITRSVETGKVGKKAHLRVKLLQRLDRARSAFERADYEKAQHWLDQLAEIIERERGQKKHPEKGAQGIDADTADELRILVRSLSRNVFLVSLGEVQPAPLLQ